ncbi:MAG TPA: hypothetical protein DEB74_07460 [Lachnospiraceae bacterium]|nr:hypothetical protein [Lachnospiraceae bacterium]
MKSSNSIFDALSSTASGARMLLETIIEDYGVQDFLQCIFYGLNETDQERFLEAAARKAGTK